MPLCVPCVLPAALVQSTRTGDTLVRQGDPRPLRLPGIPLPDPVFAQAVEAASHAHEVTPAS